MKNLFRTNNLAKLLLLIVIAMFTAVQSKGQEVKPTESGYTPVNGTKIYYEVYGEGKPLVLIHGAFMTIATNWGQLIPELSKTRKVIAVELQGHGHSPYSDRKLDLVTLASDVEAPPGRGVGSRRRASAARE